jgi:N-acetyl-gamma-glutamyl-phosphate reductase
LTISIGILGATGYTGAELIRLLHRHPEARITCCSSRQYNGKNISDVLEFLKGSADMILEEFDAGAIQDRCDVVFSCLPHGASMEFISRIVHAVKAIDLSADFRIRDLAVYRTWYQEHTCPDLLQDAVYGLCEVYRDEIRSARLVANPGCYPTSVLLPLIPLLRAGIVEDRDIIVDSKSGVSGAGRGLSLKTHICEVGESFSAYKVARSHRHVPEIEQELSRAAGHDVAIEFTAHLIPISRGMLSTIYVASASSEDDLKDCLQRFYRGSPFVRVIDGLPGVKDVRGTNRCVMTVKKSPGSSRATVISVIDNLTKGASGQAVQCMNLMFGLDEAMGLDSVPVFP